MIQVEEKERGVGVGSIHMRRLFGRLFVVWLVLVI